MTEQPPTPSVELPGGTPPPPTRLPTGSWLPFGPSPDFGGRNAELQALATGLNDGRLAVITAGRLAGKKTGPINTELAGGIGRQALAAAFAVRYGQFFSGGVFWVAASDPANLDVALAAWLRAGLDGLVSADTTLANAPLRQQANLTRERLALPTPRLLILAGADDPEIVTPFLVAGSGLRVVMTSDRRDWPAPDALVRLMPLTRAESRARLAAAMPDASNLTLDTLAETLNDHPLGLRLAAGRLLAVPDAAQLQSLLRGGETPVGRAFRAVIEALNPNELTDALALALLSAVARLSPGWPIPSELLLATLPPNVPRRAAEAGLQRLQQLGILDPAVTLPGGRGATGALDGGGEVGPAVWLPPALIKHIQALPLDHESAGAVLEETIGGLLGESAEKRAPQRVFAWLPHARQVVNNALNRNDDQTAWLSNQLGAALDALGAPRQAEPYYRRALELAEQAFGPTHPHTAASLNNLAETLQALGQPGEAQALYTRALAIYTALFGEHDRRVATLQRTLAEVCREADDLDAAQMYFEQAVATCEVAFGPDHKQTAQAMRGLLAVMRAIAARPVVAQAAPATEQAALTAGAETVPPATAAAEGETVDKGTESAPPLLDERVTAAEAAPYPDPMAAEFGIRRQDDGPQVTPATTTEDMTAEEATPEAAPRLTSAAEALVRVTPFIDPNKPSAETEAMIEAARIASEAAQAAAEVSVVLDRMGVGLVDDAADEDFTWPESEDPDDLAVDELTHSLMRRMKHPSEQMSPPVEDDPAVAALIARLETNQDADIPTLLAEDRLSAAVDDVPDLLLTAAGRTIGEGGDDPTLDEGTTQAVSAVLKEDWDQALERGEAAALNKLAEDAPPTALDAALPAELEGDDPTERYLRVEDPLAAALADMLETQSPVGEPPETKKPATDKLLAEAALEALSGMDSSNPEDAWLRDALALVAAQERGEVTPDWLNAPDWRENVYAVDSDDATDLLDEDSEPIDEDALVRKALADLSGDRSDPDSIAMQQALGLMDEPQPEHPVGEWPAGGWPEPREGTAPLEEITDEFAVSGVAVESAHEAGKQAGAVDEVSAKDLKTGKLDDDETGAAQVTAFVEALEETGPTDDADALPAWLLDSADEDTDQGVDDDELRYATDRLDRDRVASEPDQPVDPLGGKTDPHADIHTDRLATDRLGRGRPGAGAGAGATAKPPDTDQLRRLIEEDLAQARLTMTPIAPPDMLPGAPGTVLPPTTTRTPIMPPGRRSEDAPKVSPDVPDVPLAPITPPASQPAPASATAGPGATRLLDDAGLTGFTGDEPTDADIPADLAATTLLDEVTRGKERRSARYDVRTLEAQQAQREQQRKVESELPWVTAGLDVPPETRAAQQAAAQMPPPRRTPGRGHPAEAVLHQAEMLLAQGESALAVPKFEMALQMYRESLGDEHTETLACLNRLAEVHMLEGRPQAAKPLYQQAYNVLHGKRGEGHPDVALALNNLAGALRATGELDLARAYYERALKIDRKAYGTGGLGTVNTLNNLVAVIRQQGDIAAAKPLMVKLVALEEQIYGADHPSTAASLNRLGDLLRDLNELDDARKVYERALKINEHHFGPNHPDVAADLTRLAKVMRGTGQMDMAQRLHERALAIREKTLGPEHPDVAASLMSLAGLFHQRGQFDVARPLYERTLKIRERVLGLQNPDTALVLNNLSAVMFAQGDYAAAKPYLRRALTINEQTYGPDHPQTMSSVNNLARLLVALGELLAARPLLVRLLTAQEQSLGMQHPQLLMPLVYLADANRALGDYPAAIPLLERVLQIREKMHGLAHPDTAMTLLQLADSYKQANNYPEARRHYERVLAILEDTQGPEHPQVVGVLQGLADLLVRMGQFGAARLTYERILARHEKVHGANHPEVAGALRKLAELWRQMDDPNAALPLAERALQIDRAVYGESDPEVATDLELLASVLVRLGRIGSAMTELREALRIYQETLGPNHPDTARCLHGLGVLQKLSGDLPTAQETFERVLTIRERTLGEAHPDMLASLQAWAEVLIARKLYQPAWPAIEKVVRLRELSLGREHPEIARLLKMKAEVLRNLGDLAAARQLLEQALKVDEKVHGAEHAETASTLMAIATVQRAQKDASGALANTERALRIRERQLGREHPETLAALNQYAGLLRGLKNLPAARAAYEQLVAARQASLGGDHPDVAAALNNLARVTADAGDLPSAAGMLQRALTICETQLGPEHANTKAVRASLQRMEAQLPKKWWKFWE